MKNLESTSNALLVFGNGDGGGGPLAKMLENVRDTPLCLSSWLTEFDHYSCAASEPRTISIVN
jgi:hypothetical protein